MSEQRFAHLLQGVQERAEQEQAAELASAIHKAAAKARQPTNGPAPTGRAAKIIAAGKKRRGE